MKSGNCMAFFKEVLQDYIISIQIMKKQAGSLVVLASPNGGIIKGYVVKNTNMGCLNPSVFLKTPIICGSLGFQVYRNEGMSQFLVIST